MSGHEAGPRTAEPEFKELRANRSHFASALNARIADPPALAKELEDVSAEQGHGLTHMVHFIGCVNDPAVFAHAQVFPSQEAERK